MRITLASLVLISWGLNSEVTAQTIKAGSLNASPPAWFGPAQITVKTDPYSNIPIGAIPFDRYFYYRLYFNEVSEIPDKIYLRTNNSSRYDRRLGYVYLAKDPDSDNADVNLKSFYGIDILVPPLDPGISFNFSLLTSDAQRYKILFEKLYTAGGGSAMAEYNTIKAEKQARSDPFYPLFPELDSYYKAEIKPLYDKQSGDFRKADEEVDNTLAKKGYLIIGNRRIILFNQGRDHNLLFTNEFNFQTNIARRVTADAGVIAVGFTKGFMTATHYVGVSYSFRSFDTDIPFRFVRRQIDGDRLKLLSLHLGITLRSLDKIPYRDNLLNKNNIMVGAGYRLSHAINIIAGGVLYNRTNPNPLLDDKSVGMRPYVGLSVNLKVKDAIGEIAKFFTIGG